MEIRDIIATNLIALRKANKWTQAEFAEKLNYSDKAISKWERGESLPDAEILKKISDIYGVRIDYLFEEHTEDDIDEYLQPQQIKRNRIIITLLVISVVWLIATMIYIYTLKAADFAFEKNYWQLFVWAIPVSCFIGWFFNRRFDGTKLASVILLSSFTWTTILASYCQFFLPPTGSEFDPANFVLYIIGIPVQIVIILAGKLKLGKKIKITYEKNTD